jgi:hypothetical protein
MPPLDYRDVSLWTRAPLHRVYLRSRLADANYGLMPRRATAVTALAWLPLLVLTLVEGHALRGVDVPFLLDIERQTRLLFVLPLLIAGEVIVHHHVPVTIRQFVERRIIVDAARPQFDAAVASAMRWSRSGVAEIVILLLVYTMGLGLGLLHGAALGKATWYRGVDGDLSRLTLAGWWYALVSLPLFQFVMFRWYWRMMVWTRFLWQVSRIDLNLVAMHPDRRAGLGF